VTRDFKIFFYHKILYQSHCLKATVKVESHDIFSRESAANAVRAALVVTTQREMTKQTRHQHLTWYKTCYDATATGLVAVDVSESSGKTQQQKEDRVHGSLLALAELLRCSHAEWERVNRELEENIINIEASSGSSGKNVFTDAAAVSASPEKSSKFTGAVKKYYHAGLNRHARTGGNVSQIPFNWFGSVAIGKEQVNHLIQYTFVFIKLMESWTNRTKLGPSFQV